MVIHTVRDYLTQNITTTARSFIPGYLIGIFMRRILGFTYIGDTNYPINAVGTLLISTADTTPTQPTPTFAVNTKAAINQGTGREYYVWIPPAVRAVSVSDVGRLMVLRSMANPAFNSGIFLITGFESLSYTVQTTSGTGVSPITITTTANHALTTGQTVSISGVTGNTNANGIFTVNVTGANTFTIPATGNGTGSTGTVLTNNYIIDYRVMNAAPPQEAFDSMNWYIYEADTASPVSGAVNTNTSAQYRGSGNSTTPRIILQSPHPLGWQVRLCSETFQDYSAGVSQGNGNVATITCAPGFGGNSAGDFPAGGQHLHTAMYYNSSSFNLYGGGTPGFGDDSSVSGGVIAIQSRITITGDDNGQGVALIIRREGNPANPRGAFCIFGLPENEPTPLPVNNAARLFCIGSGQSTSPGNNFGNFLNDLTLGAGTITANAASTSQGTSQTQGGIPCSAASSLWTYVSGVGVQGSPIYDGSAGDSPWAAATDLQTVDVMVGSINTWNASSTPGFPLEPRVIGTLPLVRIGRSANFDEFTLTTDNARAWQHTRRGVYLIWNGPPVIP